MNAGETTDNGAHTWVDLLNCEEASGRSDAGRFRGGVKVSSRTPRANRTASRLTGQGGTMGEVVGQGEGLRAQVMSLLKDKQDMRKKMEAERKLRQRLEMELAASRLQGGAKKVPIPLANHVASSAPLPRNGLDSALTDLQLLNSLQDALDQATKEKKLLDEQLQHECQMGQQLKSGLTEIESKLRVSRQRMKEKEKHCATLQEAMRTKSAELDSLRGSHLRLHREMSSIVTQLAQQPGLGPVAQQLERVMQEDDRWVGSEGGALPHLPAQLSEVEKQCNNQRQLVLELRGTVSSLEDQLAHLGSERDALKERLRMVESQRQFSVSQYQEEVETRMLEVTSQLEELLQLNQQLQKELMSSQNEREVLMESLRKEINSTKALVQENERLQQALSRQGSGRERAESQVAELRAAVAGRQVAVEKLEARLRETESSSKSAVATLEAKVSRLEEERLKSADAQDQLLAVCSEREQTAQLLATYQVQCNKLRSQAAQMERDDAQLRGDLARLQQEKAGLEAELGSARAELKASEKRCGHYQSEIRELREFSQTHSRQQVGHLTQQLVDSARKLEESLVETRELQSRNKKLEGKLHEMALASEMSSSQLQKSMRTMATDFDSTLSDLEHSRSDNTVLKKQVSELETVLASARQQLLEKDQVLKDLRGMLQERTNSVSKLEATIGQLRKESSELEAATLADRATRSQEAESLRMENKSLVVQIHSLTDAVEQARTETEALSVRLSAELEKVVAASQAERRLREDNAKLQELLTTTIDLSERLQSSLEQSQLDSSLSKGRGQASNASGSFAEVRLTPDSLSPTTMRHDSIQASVESSLLPGLSSSGDEVLGLRERLNHSRQSCLRLEALRASDQTQLAKVQGSLQALEKIHDHLTAENRSLVQTASALERERDETRREWQRASGRLEAAESELAATQEKEAAVRKGLEQSVSRMAESCQEPGQLQASISSLVQTLRAGQVSSYDRELSEVLNVLFSSLLERQQEVASLLQLRNELEEKLASYKVENEQRTCKIAALESRCSEIASHVGDVERELEARERELREREGELAEAIARRDGGGDDGAWRKVEEQVKDMETQYQAKLEVLRDGLVSREQEVAGLRRQVTDLQDGLFEAKHSLTLAQEELRDVRRELHVAQTCLAQTEGLLDAEVGLLEEEASRVATETAALRAEAAEAREGGELARSISAHQRGQVEVTEEQITRLRGDVETLRARKTVLHRYLLSQEQMADDSLLAERDQLAHDSEQLVAENEALRAKLHFLAENSQRLQGEVESLVSQLAAEAVDNDVPLSHERELALRAEYQQQLDREVCRATKEAEAANSALRRECAVAETELETERLRRRTVEGEREAMAEEVGKLRRRLRQAEAAHSWVASETVAERDASLANIQSPLQQGVSSKEVPEGRSNDVSSDSLQDASPNSSKKVDRLKAKLKQQSQQTNHLRTKLGYAISELRLYKQLKQEMDNQIGQLQEALALSQDQSRQCIQRLENMEQYAHFSPRDL